MPINSTSCSEFWRMYVVFEWDITNYGFMKIFIVHYQYWWNLLPPKFCTYLYGKLYVHIHVQYRSIITSFLHAWHTWHHDKSIIIPVTCLCGPRFETYTPRVPPRVSSICIYHSHTRHAIDYLQHFWGETFSTVNGLFAYFNILLF